LSDAIQEKQTLDTEIEKEIQALITEAIKEL